MSSFIEPAIAGVMIRPLKHFADERGTLHHMLRADDPHFQQFGEIYFSGVREGMVKGWRVHRRLTANLAVPIGAIRLVLFDDRADSVTKGRKMVIETGTVNYALITIPPGVWSAWQGIGPNLSLVANCATEPHDPAETEAAGLSPGVIAHDWNA